MVIKVLNQSAVSANVDEHTREEPLKLFHKNSLMIKGERNWCTVKESDGSDYASLNFQVGVKRKIRYFEMCLMLPKPRPSPSECVPVVEAIWDLRKIREQWRCLKCFNKKWRESNGGN